MMKNKKGTAAFGLLQVGVLALVVVGILLAIGMNVTSTVGTTFTANSLEANATADANEGLSKISGFMPVLGIVIAAVAVLALVMLFRKTQ